VIHAIHGFLGSGSDWDFLRDAGFEVNSPDLFADFPIAASMEEWAGNFVDSLGQGHSGAQRRLGVRRLAAAFGESLPRPLRKRQQAAALQGAAAPRSQSHDTLIGYSLGGRLTLHALLADREHRIKNAIIISAGLGIEGAAARAERRRNDDLWATRFESDVWNDVVRDWNAQPLFGGRQTPNLRLESAFDRRALADALRRWSPAVHEPLEGRLHEIAARVLWIAGEDDERYVAEGRRAVERLPDATLWICPGAGHRVPWEQPERFIERLQTFLEERD
jgi:2-succinyl-6-hydroxy-2,4-cyclohexadiene-1-carboxylate synthase